MTKVRFIKEKGAECDIYSQRLSYIATLTRESDNLLLLLFDLNLKDKDENHLIKFRLEEEASAKDKDSPGWVVAINFDFVELGPIQAKLHLTENTISTVFRAEKENTVKIISEQIKLLDVALKETGFDAINPGVVQGGISQPRDIPDSVHMLDEKA